MLSIFKQKREQQVITFDRITIQTEGMQTVVKFYYRDRLAGELTKPGPLDTINGESLGISGLVGKVTLDVITGENDAAKDS